MEMRKCLLVKAPQDNRLGLRNIINARTRDHGYYSQAIEQAETDYYSCALRVAHVVWWRSRTRTPRYTLSRYTHLSADCGANGAPYGRSECQALSARWR